MRPGEAMPPLARTVAMSRTFCPDSVFSWRIAAFGSAI
jgi:hypothetical protein